MFTSTDQIELIEKVNKLQPAKPQSVNANIPLDLQTIILKAMEKDPNRRYTSAAAMADDLYRFRHHQPILARRVGPVERLWLWSKTNKLLASSLAMISLLLIGGSVGSLLAALQIGESRDQAELAANRKQNIVDSFVEAFSGTAATNVEMNSETTAIEVLNKALDTLESNPVVAEDPIAKATLLHSIGRPLISLGEVETGIECLESVLKIRTRELGRGHLDTTNTMSFLASGYEEAGQFEKAATLHQESLELIRKHHGSDHIETLRAEFNVANMLKSQGREREAMEIHQRLREKMLASKGPEHRYTLAATVALADDFRIAGRYDEAVDLQKQVYDIRMKTYGNQHSDTLQSMYGLATALDAAGRYEDSIAMWMESSEARIEKFGPNNIWTLRSQVGLGATYSNSGNYGQAIEVLKDALPKVENRFGKDHRFAQIAINGLALAYKDTGQSDKALPLFELLLKNKKLAPGDYSSEYLTAKINLAEIYKDKGRFEDALVLLEQVYKYAQEYLPAAHPKNQLCMNNLADAYFKLKRHDEAIPLFQKVLELKQQNLPPDHPSLLMGISNLATAYNLTGQVDKALPLLEDVYARSKESLGASNRNTILRLNNLASGYRNAKQYSKAIEMYQEALDSIQSGELSKNHVLRLTFQNNLGQAYQADGKHDLALPHLLSAFELALNHLGKDHPNTLGLIRNLALLFKDSKQYALGASEFQALLEKHSNLPQDHSISQSMRSNLADFYYGAEEFGIAVPFYSAKLQRFQESLGSDHKHSISIARVFSDTMIQAGMYKEAKSEIEKLLQVLKSTEDPDEAALVGARIAFAETLIGLDEFEDAMQQLEITQESELQPIQKARVVNLKGHLLALAGETKQAQPLLVSSSEQLAAEHNNLTFHRRWYLTSALERTIDFLAANDQSDEAESWRRRLDGFKTNSAN